MGQASHLLPDSRVLVAGGYADGETRSSCELFDPSSGGWVAAPKLKAHRYSHGASTTPDGDVIITGRFNEDGGLSSTTVFRVSDGRWEDTGELVEGRFDHRSVSLDDGRTLVVGGRAGSNVLASSEIYSPSRDNWRIACPDNGALRHPYEGRQSPCGGRVERR